MLSIFLISFNIRIILFHLKSISPVLKNKETDPERLKKIQKLLKITQLESGRVMEALWPGFWAILRIFLKMRLQRKRKLELTYKDGAFAIHRTSVPVDIDELLSTFYVQGA